MLFSKSMLTKAVACAALCASSVPAMAAPAACVGGAQGCVLPLPEPVVVQPVQTVAPPVVMLEEPTGLGIIPILAGLAALGLLAYLLLDDDEESVSP